MIPFRLLPKILFSAAAVLYPIIIFYSLVILKMPLRAVSLFVVGFALFAFLILTTTTNSAVPSAGAPPLKKKTVLSSIRRSYFYASDFLV